MAADGRRVKQGQRPVYVRIADRDGASDLLLAMVCRVAGRGAFPRRCPPGRRVDTIQRVRHDADVSPLGTSLKKRPPVTTTTVHWRAMFQEKQCCIEVALDACTPQWCPRERIPVDAGAAGHEVFNDSEVAPKCSVRQC